VIICVGQDVTKQQFQINLVSSTDPIDVLLVNKDSDADEASITPLPPLFKPTSELSSAAKKLPSLLPASSQAQTFSVVTTAAASLPAAEMKHCENASLEQTPDSNSPSGVHICISFLIMMINHCRINACY